jgi:plastocyanin
MTGLLVMAVGSLAVLPVGAQTTDTTEAPSTPPPEDLTKEEITKKVKVKVKVGDNYFKPKKLTVVVGDTVLWKWVGTAIHDVVVDEGPKKFKSKKQARGKFKREIVEPGEYLIVCTLHPGMEMTLTAEPAPPPTTTTAPAP